MRKPSSRAELQRDDFNRVQVPEMEGRPSTARSRQEPKIEAASLSDNTLRKSALRRCMS